MFRDIKIYNHFNLYLQNLICAWNIILPDYADCAPIELTNFLLIIKIPLYKLNINEKFVMREINCYFNQLIVKKVLLKNKVIV